MKNKINICCFVILLLLLVIYEYSSYEYFLYLFYGITIANLFFNKSKIALPGYLLSLVVLMYSIGPLLFIISSNINLESVNNEYVDVFANNKLYIKGFTITAYFLLGLNLSYISDSKIISNIKLKASTNDLNSIKLISIFTFFLLFYGMSKIDFKSIEGTYLITTGYSVVMGSVYIFNFLSLYLLIRRIYIKTPISLIIIMLLPNLLLFYLGTRQVFIVLIFSFILYLLSFNRIKVSKKLFFKALGIYFLFSFVTIFRDTKSINSNIFSLDFLYSGIVSFFYESFLTYYNLLGILDNNYAVSEVPYYAHLNQLFYQLIPSFFLENKDHFMILSLIANKYSLTPFGTFFIIGEFYLIYKIKFFIFLTAFAFSKLLTSFKPKNGLVIEYAFWFYTLVILYFLSVRGMIAPSIKIAFTIVFPIYYLIKKSIKIY